MKKLVPLLFSFILWFAPVSLFPQDGYMTRSYGEFLSTNDGGESWDFNNQELIIFPNPAQSVVTVSFCNPNHHLLTSLTIYNVFGQQMIKKEIKGESNTVVIDLPGYQPGIYLVVIKQGSETKSSGKFIVQSK